MKLALPLIAILLAFNWYATPVNNSVAYKRSAKLFYDRIEIGVEPVRVQRCKPGLIWWKDNCWRLERIVSK